MTAAWRRAPALGGAPEIGRRASDCLRLELATYPKPGLVSFVDSGAHRDMDAAMLARSAEALEPYFADLAAAGAVGAEMGRLRAIGIAAEDAMLAATGGINTHRGAIFGLGLLCAAAGFRSTYGPAETLGAIVSIRWGPDIAGGPVPLRSHGTEVARRHGVGGARAEAVAGYPSVYIHAIPALAEARMLAPGDEGAARVHACMALIASVDDTNLFYRGGRPGADFARAAARGFLERGGVGRHGWLGEAERIHRRFVRRNLSPGGCADLLAMALFAEAAGG